MKFDGVLRKFLGVYVWHFVISFPKVIEFSAIALNIC